MLLGGAKNDTGQGNTQEDVRLDVLNSLGITESEKRFSVSALQICEKEEIQLEYASEEFVDNRIVRVVVVRLNG